MYSTSRKARNSYFFIFRTGDHLDGGAFEGRGGTADLKCPAVLVTLGPPGGLGLRSSLSPSSPPSSPLPLFHHGVFNPFIKPKLIFARLNVTASRQKGLVRIKSERDAAQSQNKIRASRSERGSRNTNSSEGNTTKEIVVRFCNSSVRERLIHFPHFIDARLRGQESET